MLISLCSLAGHWLQLVENEKSISCYGEFSLGLLGFNLSFFPQQLNQHTINMERDPQATSQARGLSNGIGIGCGCQLSNLVRCMHGQTLPYTLLLWFTSPMFDFQHRVALAPFTSQLTWNRILKQQASARGLPNLIGIGCRGGQR